METMQFGARCMTWHLGLALLQAVSCIKVANGDRLMFWRERARGLNVSSWMLARFTVNSWDILSQCILYTATYYCVARPDLAFQWYLIPCLLVSWAASGFGYAMAAVVPP